MESSTLMRFGGIMPKSIYWYLITVSDTNKYWGWMAPMLTADYVYQSTYSKTVEFQFLTPPNYLTDKILCGKLKYRWKPFYSIEERTFILAQGCHGSSGKIIEITSKYCIVLSEVTVFGYSTSKLSVVISRVIFFF